MEIPTDYSRKGQRKPKTYIVAELIALNRTPQRNSQPPETDEFIVKKAKNGHRVLWKQSKRPLSFVHITQVMSFILGANVQFSLG